MEGNSKHYYETSAADYFRQTHGRNLEAYWWMLGRRLESASFILDIGCGSGRDLKRFSESGFSTIGIDFSLPLLKLAAAFSRQPVVLGDFRALPFASASFDAAWALASLLHVDREKIDHVVTGINRCLKPGGVFFAAVKMGWGQEIDSSGRLNTYYSLDEWSDTLRRSGFNPIETNVSTERRLLNDGSSRDVSWIACLSSTIKSE